MDPHITPTENLQLIFNLTFIQSALFIGIGATLVMDVWAWCANRFFAIPSLNYGLVGRWLGHVFKGQFKHTPIHQSAPIPAENVIGWSAHYLIGVVFAGALILLVEIWKLDNPHFLASLLVGLLTLLFPFLLLQPGFGMGIAAAKTPNPNQIRFRSLMAHSAFGLGLFCASVAYKLLFT